jgi:hypothetical protein
MKSIFVFCAYDARARENFEKTILNLVPAEVVLSHVGGAERERLLPVAAAWGGFYAWGFRSGKRLISSLWNKIEPGDLCLGYFKYHYRVAARLLAKVESEGLANDLWANRPGITQSWRNVVLLSKPCPISVHGAAVGPYLPGEYRGAMRVADERVARIVGEFGSIETFAERKLGVVV